MKKIISIILIAWCNNFVHSQELELLKIKKDSAEINLERVDIYVEVIGNVATTVTEMTFYNPNDRALEGELNFPLAENQRIYRFALDFNGKLREGVAVEKNLGRRAFEGVVRQNIDPALLEMTTGNNYKARIYPIPANGRRKILIGYEEELQYSKQPLYQLAMSYGKVKDFQLKINVVQQSLKPKIKRNDLVNFEFEKWGQAYIAKYAANELNATGVLSFEIPTNLKETVFRESGSDGDFVYLTVNPKAVRIDKKKPRTLGILWDASNSSKNRYIEKELELLKVYLNNFEQLDVTIIRFSDVLIDKTTHKVSNGNSGDLINYLQSTIYDGGTNLANITFDEFSSDELLLFSDGITNLGELKFSRNTQLTYTICSSKIADLTLLKYVANSTGGQFINLINTSLNDAKRALLTNDYRFLGATYNKNKISEVYPNVPTAVQENTTFTVAARIKSKEKASLKLTFGIGNKVMETKEVSIDNSVNTTSIARLWAHKKVDQLVLHPAEQREQIIQLGKSYGLVTPYTSLIVLDRVEDYVRYEINPPVELKGDYDLLIKEKGEEKKLNDVELVELTLENYQDRVDWWNLNLKDSKVYVLKADERRPNEEQSQETEIEEPVDPVEIIEEEPEIDQEVQQVDRRARVPMIPIDSTGFDKVVSGLITSMEDGSRLPGVNVIVKGTTRGTITDINGFYRIAVNNDEILVYSFIGMVSEEFEIGGRTEMDVALDADARQLSEVVVTAMGVEVTHRSLGYAISTVTETVQSQVPGIQIEGSQPEAMVIRGNSSVVVGAKPMYLIDGVIVDQSEFEGINPREVASMNVINEVEGTRMYGARAADGVIVIMTKDALDKEIFLPDSITNQFEQTLVIKDWQADEPYLDSLKNTALSDRYKTYLELREIYGSAPSFYLSVGSFFIDEGQKEIGLRILSNIAELDLENYELLKMLAHKYKHLGSLESSIYLFNKIAKIREGEPHSLRDLALSHQANGDYQKALELLHKIVITIWHDDERFPLIKSTVLGEMNNLIALHSKNLDLSNISKDLIKTMPVDIRVVLDWNTLETDLDLWITEPGGERCYFSNDLTVNGGRLVEDYTDGYGPEEYLLKNAPQGEYTIEVDYYDDRVQKIAGPTTLQVTIFTNYGRKSQEQKSMTLQLKEQEEAVKVGDFIWKNR